MQRTDAARLPKWQSHANVMSIEILCKKPQETASNELDSQVNFKMLNFKECNAVF